MDVLTTETGLLSKAVYIFKISDLLDASKIKGRRFPSPYMSMLEGDILHCIRSQRILSPQSIGNLTTFRVPEE